ncbi:hypothetical protein AB1N83_004195 [Pleurotus pulmonarius]
MGPSFKQQSQVEREPLDSSHFTIALRNKGERYRHRKQGISKTEDNGGVETQHKFKIMFRRALPEDGVIAICRQSSHSKYRPAICPDSEGLQDSRDYHQQGGLGRPDSRGRLAIDPSSLGRVALARLQSGGIDFPLREAWAPWRDRGYADERTSIADLEVEDSCSSLELGSGPERFFNLGEHMPC